MLYLSRWAEKIEGVLDQARPGLELKKKKGQARPGQELKKNEEPGRAAAHHLKN